ncbi:MAG TPA: hypothetical protein VG028_05520 [Terriglobia bacterium]|nr:hypothetical protein [Terriglobia bacterium]
MPTDKSTIKIISGPPPTPAGAEPESLPREGEFPGVAEEHLRWPHFTSKPVKQLTDEIANLKGQLAVIVQHLAQSVVDNATLDEISVGLAVSLEGDIGIASAGAEASIELKFKVKSSS